MIILHVMKILYNRNKDHSILIDILKSRTCLKFVGMHALMRQLVLNHAAQLHKIFIKSLARILS